MTVNLKRLKAERIASGMTQDEVAHKMGWKTRTPYAKRENGLVSIGADELAKITLIFGLPMEKITIFLTTTFPKRNTCQLREEPS
ncbi:helix-turn-helix domain-containing protein [Streptococcus agalactiae]|uniref:helix-turn-helix domain-containing protein n=1 Tax=Streptococcus agalactiae TaxID=1311 RepID=UPI001CCFC82B|nr:helix-turn-helix transcriptional regulator [Streptococcus agalactiae]